MAGDVAIQPPVQYSDDKKDPDNYVYILVDIKGLKKKLFSEAASNAEVNLELGERCFNLTVTVKGEGKNSAKTYQYGVKCLPGLILTDPKRSFCKVKKKGEVTIYLHKAHPGSWSRQLASEGLETAQVE